MASAQNLLAQDFQRATSLGAGRCVAGSEEEKT